MKKQKTKRAQFRQPKNLFFNKKLEKAPFNNEKENGMSKIDERAGSL
jgi:hypothetical protein